jgi:exodeoxyribonuclease V gamma subunit
VTFRLRVAPTLDLLVDDLVQVLARPLDDPFVPDVVAVPGDGVRAWLIHRLAERLGTPGAGIVANIEFVYPAEVVRRALGADAVTGAWSVGPLTWVVHALLDEHGESLGQPAGLMRARSIADLFDRYTLHRPAMVTAWGAGRDVDAADQALAPDHLWQPRLWRLVRDRLGGTSDAEQTARAALDLAVGRRDPQLPDRVVLFGLASMPSPHLRVIAALARSTDVHVLAPAPSLSLWNDLRSLPSEPLHLPLDRRDDPSAHLGRHPLLASWGRAAREAHLLLLDATREVDADVAAIVPAPLTVTDDTPLLTRLQVALEGDVTPVLDDRPVLAPDDRSVEWHRCHGPARQVEVLRDIVLHLLQETDPDGSPRFEPRDIAVLCPDVPTFAPFAQAAFAGDPENGVPSVPLRIADRSLRADNPLLDALGALLGLLDGRFAASAVLAFVSLPPVRHRYDLDTDRVERIGAWAQATNVRWGLDASHRQAYGLPVDVVAHSWQCGLDQLLLGATMADAGPRLGPGGTVPYGDIEGSDVETAGLLAELLHDLERSVTGMSGPTTVGSWCDVVADAARSLFAVPDEDAHLWRDLDALLTEVRDDAAVVEASGAPVLDGSEIAALLLERLARRSGRPRFGTGAVTLSSLTAQRGVPHRVVVLLGLDGDIGGSGVAGADDLSASPACLGDRDPRSEVRAQLLDAVRSAGERLVLLSTGRDVRTNAEIAPAVPLAELIDVIDATVRSAVEGSAHVALSLDHPRQAWNIRTVTPDALRPGPWTFDTGVIRAAAVVRAGERPGPLLVTEADTLARISVRDLVTVVRNPVRSLLQGRLGVWLDKEADPVEDLIPVDLTPLELWQVCEDLLAARLDAGVLWDDLRRDAWIDVQRALGAIPPLDLGRDELRDADGRVAALLQVRDEVHGTGTLALTETVGIDLDVVADGETRSIVGEIPAVCDNVAVTLSSSRLRPAATLQCWVHASALAAQTGRPARAAVVGRPAKDRAAGPTAQAVVVEVASADAGRRALEMLVDMLLRARRSVVPVMPTTSRSLFLGDEAGARDAWTGGYFPGEGGDPWVSFVRPGLGFEDLVADASLPDEAGDGWTDHLSRVERWSHRVWGTLHATADVRHVPAEATDG